MSVRQLFAHIYWLIERNTNRSIPRNYGKGVFEVRSHPTDHSENSENESCTVRCSFRFEYNYFTEL